VNPPTAPRPLIESLETRQLLTVGGLDPTFGIRGQVGLGQVTSTLNLDLAVDLVVRGWRRRAEVIAARSASRRRKRPGWRKPRRAIAARNVSRWMWHCFLRRRF